MRSTCPLQFQWNVKNQNIFYCLKRNASTSLHIDILKMIFIHIIQNIILSWMTWKILIYSMHPKFQIKTLCSLDSNYNSIPGQYQSTILFPLKRLFYQKWKIDLIKIIILKHIIKIILFCVLYFKRYKLYLYLSQLYINTA